MDVKGVGCLGRDVDIKREKFGSNLISEGDLVLGRSRLALLHTVRLHFGAWSELRTRTVVGIATIIHNLTLTPPRSSSNSSKDRDGSSGG